MIKIESRESFLLEFQTLQRKIDQSILELAEFQGKEMQKPSISITEKINRLKYHRKNLEDMLEVYQDVGHELWSEIKPKAQDIFDKAENEWLKPSKDLKNV